MKIHFHKKMFIWTAFTLPNHIFPFSPFSLIRSSHLAAQGEVGEVWAYRPLQKGSVLTGTRRVAQQITLWKSLLNHIWIINFPSQQTPPLDTCMPNKIAVIAWIINEITEEFIWEYLSLATHKNALSALPLIPDCWSKDKITAMLVFSGLVEKVRTSRVLWTQQNHKKVVQILIKLWV